MAIVLTTTPTYALPGDAVPLTASITGGTGATFIRLWCTDAPEGSVYKTLLQKTGATRIEITPPDAPSAGGISPTVPFNAQLDKGGRYTFVGQEYSLGATSYGGGYSNAPDAYKTETKIGSEQTLYIYIGQRLTQRLGSSAYGNASLLVYAWNDTIRATTIETHGVLSPDIILPSSPRAASAAAATAVRTQLAAFAGLAVSALAPNLNALAAEVRTKIPLHFNNNGGTYHRIASTGAASPDTDNDTAIERLPGRCTTPAELVQTANVLYGRLRAHMTNGFDGLSTYHDNNPDYVNLPIADGAGGEADLSYAYAAVADVLLAYTQHRADTTSHGVADVTNTVTTALGPLLTLHQYFLAAMRGLAPSTNGGQQSAVVTLTANGFRLG